MRLDYPVGGGSERSLRLCLGRIVGGGKGDGKGKGAESKRHGSLAIATSEQADGWVSMIIGCLWASGALGWGILLFISLSLPLPLFNLIRKPDIPYLPPTHSV
jgi:hypothetical protein